MSWLHTATDRDIVTQQPVPGLNMPTQIETQENQPVPQIQQTAPEVPTVAPRQVLALLIAERPEGITVTMQPPIGELISKFGRRLSTNWTVEDYNFDGLKTIKFNIVKALFASLQSGTPQQHEWIKSSVTIDKVSNSVFVPKSLSMIARKKPIVLTPDTGPMVMESLHTAVYDLNRTLQNYRIDATVEIQNAAIPEPEQPAGSFPVEADQQFAGYDLKFEFIKGQYEPDYHFRINLRQEFSPANFKQGYEQWRNRFLELVTRAIFHVSGKSPKKVADAAPVVLSGMVSKRHVKHAAEEVPAPVTTIDMNRMFEKAAPAQQPEYISSRSFNIGSAERRKQAIVDARQDVHYYDDRDGYLYLRGSWNAYGRFVVLLNNQFGNASLKAGLALLMKTEEQEGRAGLKKGVRTIRAGVTCVNSMADNFVQDNWVRDENFEKVHYPDVYFDEHGQPHRPGDKPGRSLDLFQRRKDPLKLDERTGLPATDVPRFMYAIKDYAIHQIDPKTGQMEVFWPKPGHKRTILTMYSNQRNICGDETGVGKCQAGSTRICVNDQVTTLEKLWNDYAMIVRIKGTDEWGWSNRDLFIHSCNSDGKIVAGRIYKLFRQRYRGSLYKIATTNGKTILCTADHKILTPNGFVKASKLAVDDFVCSPKIQPRLLHDVDADIKLAEFLAWQIAEGCECNDASGQFSITQSDTAVLQKLKFLFKQIGYHCRGAITSSRSSNYVRFCSIQYRRHLESKGYIWGKKSQEKVIPEFIMLASDETVRTFLRAFFDAEAHSCERRHRIELSSASKTLVYQISVLLNRFGIYHMFDKREKMATNGSRIKRQYYYVNIVGSGFDVFMEQIGFAYAYKNSSKKLINPNKEGKPLKHILGVSELSIPYRHFGLRNQKYISGPRLANQKDVRSCISHLQSVRDGSFVRDYSTQRKSKWSTSVLERYNNISTQVVSASLQKLEKLYNNDLCYENVNDIEMVPWDDYVYDLCVDNYHNYVSEQLVTHNTSEYIIAADIRTNKENAVNIARTFGNSSGRVLVITLAGLVPQFENNIREILGEQASISNDPGANAKWTIMSYDAFRSDPKSKPMQALVKSVVSQCYDVMVLDEAHSLKNSSSNRSRNIAAICDYIPFIWMGSATISANRPVDIHHLLKMLGHPLGQLSQAEFMRQYTEMTTNDNRASQYVDQTRADNQAASAEGYDIANVPAFLKEVVFPSREYASLGSIQEKIQHAQQMASIGLKSLVDRQVEKIMNLSAMLILTNVYTRQTKEDVWKEEARLKHPGKSIEDIENALPKQIENEILVPPQRIGQDALREINQEAMHSNDPKGFAVIRKVKIAERKVPITTENVAKIWEQAQGDPNSVKKVLVFTEFHESGRLLTESLSQTLDAMFPGQGFTCIRAIGPDISIAVRDDDPRNRLKLVNEFKTNPLAKALVLGIESGGTGLDVPNITSDCFFNDLPWTPRAIVQAKGRIYRMKTKEDVNIYYVAVDGTPDKMYAASLKKKEALANMVQGINKAYADKVQNHQDTSEEVARSRELYWDLVMGQVRDAVITNEFIRTGVYYDVTQDTTQAQGWCHKVVFSGLNRRIIQHG
jgi:intein/homing endonuclease